MIIHKKWALEYETGSCSCFMSFIYKWFPNYFTWRFERKYKRYTSFKKYQEYELYAKIKSLS